MDIHSDSFYGSNLDKDAYVKAQKDRHKAKANKKRDRSHYEACANEIRPLISRGGKMVCLGTRNNHERNCFDEFLEDQGIDAFSLDISPLSKADFIMDFNELPKEWEEKWDIVFSNSLDHSISATKAFSEWLRVVAKGGILVVGFCVGENDLTAADCCTFNIDEVDEFMMQKNEKFHLIKKFQNSYTYYVVRKA